MWILPRGSPMMPMRFFMARVSPAMPWVLPMGTLMKVSASRASVTRGQEVMATPSGMSTRSKLRLLRYLSVAPGLLGGLRQPRFLEGGAGAAGGIVEHGDLGRSGLEAHADDRGDDDRVGGRGVLGRTAGEDVGLDHHLRPALDEALHAAQLGHGGAHVLVGQVAADHGQVGEERGCRWSWWSPSRVSPR